MRGWEGGRSLRKRRGGPELLVYVAEGEGAGEEEKEVEEEKQASRETERVKTP